MNFASRADPLSLTFLNDREVGTKAKSWDFSDLPVGRDLRGVERRRGLRVPQVLRRIPARMRRRRHHLQQRVQAATWGLSA